MITQHDLDAIWLDVDPPAKDAFERMAKDHGKRFAEQTRDHVLACKQLSMNELAISGKCPRPVIADKSAAACIGSGNCGCYATRAAQ